MMNDGPVIVQDIVARLSHLANSRNFSNKLNRDVLHSFKNIRSGFNGILRALEGVS